MEQLSASRAHSVRYGMFNTVSAGGTFSVSGVSRVARLQLTTGAMTPNAQTGNKARNTYLETLSDAGGSPQAIRTGTPQADFE